MIRKRSIVTLVAVLAVLGAIGAYWASTRKPEKTEYESVAVSRGRLTARVTATGTLSALVTVQVGSQVSGRIQQIFVDFNSPVEKGQVVAKIDSQLYQAAVEQARANHAAAGGNLTKTKAQAVDASRQYERAKALFERKLVAQADLDTAQSNAEAAQAGVAASQGQVEQTRAALHQAQVNLDYTTILSPIKGVVISRSVDVGQTVAASLQAPTLFTIAEDLQKMQVDTNVAEADVGKLVPGMESSFTVDAYPSERFRGKVRQIRNAPQTLQNVVTYDAVIDVSNAALKLKPGMTANVTFVYAERDNVVRIPNAALRFRPPPGLGQGGGRWGGGGGARGGQGGGGIGASSGREGGGGRRRRDEELTSDRKTVYRLEPSGELKPVPIRIGVTDGSLSEVLEGELHEGERVATEIKGDNAPTRIAPPGSTPGGGGMRRIF